MGFTLSHTHKEERVPAVRAPPFSIFTKTITTFPPKQSQHGSTKSVKVNVLQKDEREKHVRNKSRETHRERHTDQFLPLHPF